MKVSLVVVKTDGSRRDFPLVKERVVIGRTNHCDLRVPMPSVSRKHCEIIVEGDRVKLRDAGSSNGTFHNDTRVMEAILEPGDRIGVGSVVFAVLIDGQPTDLALPPVIRADAPQARTSVSGSVAGHEPVDGSSHGAEDGTNEGRLHPKPLPKPLVHDGEFDMDGEIEADAHSPTRDYDQTPATTAGESGKNGSPVSPARRPMPIPQPRKPS